jgi:hypothetical protein
MRFLISLLCNDLSVDVNPSLIFAGEERVPWGTRGLVGQLLLLRTGGVKNHSLQYHAKQKTRLVSARIESGRKPASKSSRPVHR